MTYATIETSQDNGKPIELLKITYSQKSWFYTTAEQPIVCNGDTYQPLAIKSGELPANDETTRSALTINVPFDCEVGELFKITPPSELVFATLFSQHFGDAEYKVKWKGRITNVKWVTPWLELNVENVFSSLRRIGLRRRYSSQCPYTVYRGGCKLSSEAFKVLGVVQSISGLDITIATTIGLGDNYFAGGFVTWTNGVRNNPEYRTVKSSVSVTGKLTLSAQTIGLSVGQEISIFPGCDHLLTTCESKFSNSINFGGTPYIPRKNPFGGSPIY